MSKKANLSDWNVGWRLLWESEDAETPQSGLLEEAQREPAESIHPEWKSRIVAPPSLFVFIAHLAIMNCHSIKNKKSTFDCLVLSGCHLTLNFCQFSWL